MNNVVNQTPYLRTSREFPTESNQLSIVCSKSYIDIAAMVNARTIGLFPTNRPSVTGESWFLSQNQRQQSLRQVYTFGTIAPGAILTIPYTTSGLDQFSRIYGTCSTSLPDYRPIPYASVAANANIDLRVDANNIIINNGAASPTLNSGIIVLEYISNAG